MFIFAAPFVFPYNIYDLYSDCCITVQPPTAMIKHMACQTVAHLYPMDIRFFQDLQHISLIFFYNDLNFAFSAIVRICPNGIPALNNAVLNVRIIPQIHIIQDH